MSCSVQASAQDTLEQINRTQKLLEKHGHLNAIMQFDIHDIHLAT